MEKIILNIVLILSAIVMTIGIISLIFLIVYLYRN